jgi:hypothetical protein
MEKSDYMSPEKFPKTSQSGLSVKLQLLLDAFKLDLAKEYLEAGGKLSQLQQEVLRELQVKEQAMESVISQLHP